MTQPVAYLLQPSFIRQQSHLFFYLLLYPCMDIFGITHSKYTVLRSPIHFTLFYYIPVLVNKLH